MSAVKLENLLNIPASGIAFASGSSLIGTALGGPIGGVIGAVLGGVAGIVNEIESQKQHDRSTKLPPEKANG